METHRRPARGDHVAENTVSACKIPRVKLVFLTVWSYSIYFIMDQCQEIHSVHSTKYNDINTAAHHMKHLTLE